MNIFWINTTSKAAIFISQETDSTGAYLLKLPSGGTYNLGIGESGSPGDAVSNSSQTIRIETGDIMTGVDLLMQ